MVLRNWHPQPRPCRMVTLIGWLREHVRRTSGMLKWEASKGGRSMLDGFFLLNPFFRLPSKELECQGWCSTALGCRTVGTVRKSVCRASVQPCLLASLAFLARKLERWKLALHQLAQGLERFLPFGLLLSLCGVEGLRPSGVGRQRTFPGVCHSRCLLHYTALPVSPRRSCMSHRHVT